MTLLLILLTLPLVLGDADLDRFRTVSYYTDYPIYRSGSGSNTVKVLVGKPAAEVQLTLCEYFQNQADLSYQCQFHPSRLLCRMY